MKKPLILFLLFIVITGCTFKESDFNSLMDKSIDNYFNHKRDKLSTNYKGTFSYYLPPSIGIKNSTKNSTVLLFGEYEFVMNLNVANIVSNHYYEDSSIISLKEDSNVVYFSENSENQEYYKILVYESNGFNYLIIETKYVSFAGKFPLPVIPEVTRICLDMGSQVKVDEERIVSEYSRKLDLKDIEITKELFGSDIPIQGYVNELLGIPEIEPETPEPDIDLPVEELED